MRNQRTTYVIFVYKSENHWNTIYDCEKSFFAKKYTFWFNETLSSNMITDRIFFFILGCLEIETASFGNYHLKHYTYLNKCTGNCLPLIKFKAIWTDVYQVEKQSTWKNNCIDQLEKKWKLFEILKTRVQCIIYKVYHINFWTSKDESLILVIWNAKVLLNQNCTFLSKILTLMDNVF